ADVVELHLVETALYGFPRERRVVVPGGGLERIDPGQAFTVDPVLASAPILHAYVQTSPGPIAGKHVVLEDDDATNHVRAVLVQRGEHCVEIVDRRGGVRADR